MAPSVTYACSVLVEAFQLPLAHFSQREKLLTRHARSLLGVDGLSLHPGQGVDVHQRERRRPVGVREDRVAGLDDPLV